MSDTQATLNKLNQMKIYGMVRAWHTTLETGGSHDLTPDEFLAYLVDAEWEDRYNRKLQRLLKQARFRYHATIEEIDLTLQRNLSKQQVLRLAECKWIEKKQDIVITGPTGAGKSFLASALGHKACTYGYKTQYHPCRKLFLQLRHSQLDGTYLKEMEKLQKAELLIIDDFGIAPLDAHGKLSLLEIIEDRHGRKSTIFVSQLPILKWHEFIGEPTIADAACDRIVHSAQRIELRGESVRKLYAKK